MVDYPAVHNGFTQINMQGKLPSSVDSSQSTHRSSNGSVLSVPVLPNGVFTPSSSYAEKTEENPKILLALFN